MSTTATTGYLWGHGSAELRRLEEQARLLAPATGTLLTLAGIEPGMRVLDVGTGAGDVAFLAARRVGPGGSVVGIDSSATALTTARHRAQLYKIGNVSFLQADIRDLDPAAELGGWFDAVVGRLVLLYVEEQAAVVARCARALRPGGVLLAMEYEMTAAGNIPAQPLSTQAMGWMLAAFAWAGHDPALGARLAGVLSEAGLDSPACVGLQTYLEPAEPAGAALLASTIRTLLPAILAAGIATAEEVGIDTLERRVLAAQQAAGAMLRLPTLVGAWARTPAPRHQPHTRTAAGSTATGGVPWST